MTEDQESMTMGEIVDDYRKRHPEADAWPFGRVFMEASIERNPGMAWFRNYRSNMGID